MAISDIMKSIGGGQRAAAGQQRRGGLNGISWGGQMPSSVFDTVVAPPTITGSGSPDFGVVPTEDEFREAMGREPDSEERKQMTGLRPFNDSTGVVLVEYDPATKTETSTQTAMHLYITPEHRKDTLLRIKREDRGGYLAIWTLLDVNQQLEIGQFRRLIESDETLKEIEELDIDDARLRRIGNYGVMQDGFVRGGSSQDGSLSKTPVPYQEFFASEKRGAKKADAAEAVQAQPRDAKPAEVVEKQEDDEMKRPGQDMPIKYKIGGSTMNRKCAYVKFNAAAKAVLVAYAEGADSDEFDEGTELTIVFGDRQARCEAGPSFEVPEAGVTCQVFSIKE